MTSSALRARMPRLSVANKVFIATAGLVVTAVFLSTFLLYRVAERELTQNVRLRLQAAAANAALLVDGKKHSLLAEPSDQSRPEYEEIRRALRRIRSVNPEIRYVYTLRPTASAKTWKFVVDPEEDPKLRSNLGDKLDATNIPDLQKALTGPASDRDFTTDRWGTWLSGYAPIYGPGGRLEAVLGLDMSAGNVNLVLAIMRRVSLLALVLGLLFAVLVAALLARWINAPLKEFIASARAVSDGNFARNVEVHSRDEFGEVASTFNKMLVSLEQGWQRMLAMAYRDPLTDLHNHRYLQERLALEISRSLQYERSMSLLMVDIDRFRVINDTYGHPVGDTVLQGVARALKEQAREFDLVARYGGEEFVLILPETSLDDAMALAERCRKAVEELHIPTGADRSVRVTVSIGVSEITPDMGQGELIMASELALYQAKQLSRNCVCIYEPSDREDAARGLSDLYQFIRNPDLGAIQALAAAVDAKDHYTRNHSENVSNYAVLLGRAVGLDESGLDRLRIGGLLHDIGKIGIPDVVLNKPGKLDNAEYDLIKAHPSIGDHILRNSPNLLYALPIVKHHHERYDGTGYPDGLARTAIPIEARITSVADTFDALTTNRPYRKAMSRDTAILEMQRCSGTQLDPVLVQAFVANLCEAQAPKAA